MPSPVLSPMEGLVALWIFAFRTFIDLDHMIIPHEVAWGGVAIGIVCSVALPQMMGQSSHLAGGLWSLLAAVAGYALLWGVVEAGKIVFGRKRIVFDPPEKFSWK